MPEWLNLILNLLTPIILLFVLAGLIVPIFPGLAIMWFVILIYAIAQNFADNMTGWDWFLFAVITLLTIAGSIGDNILIAVKMRDHFIPWSSILIGFGVGIIASIFFTPLVGLLAAPGALFFAEQRRLKDRSAAWNSTKAYMVGWGWAFGLRFIIGLAIIGSWMLWAWI